MRAQGRFRDKRYEQEKMATVLLEWNSKSASNKAEREDLRRTSKPNAKSCRPTPAQIRDGRGSVDESDDLVPVEN